MDRASLARLELGPRFPAAPALVDLEQDLHLVDNPRRLLEIRRRCTFHSAYGRVASIGRWGRRRVAEPFLSVGFSGRDAADRAERKKYAFKS